MAPGPTLGLVVLPYICPVVLTSRWVRNVFFELSVVRTVLGTAVLEVPDVALRLILSSNTELVGQKVILLGLTVSAFLAPELI